MNFQVVKGDRYDSLEEDQHLVLLRLRWELFLPGRCRGGA